MGIFFSKFLEEGILNLFDKTHESMGLCNVKTTTTMPLSCSDQDSVDEETSGLGAASNHE